MPNRTPRGEALLAGMLRLRREYPEGRWDSVESLPDDEAFVDVIVRLWAPGPINDDSEPFWQLSEHELSGMVFTEHEVFISGSFAWAKLQNAIRLNGES